MERRKLTKEDIDKVRHIEGFPIAKDDDIIALSDAPYYTACPNPYIEEFIRENGTPYEEASDEYHREPFASDVSEGKNDPIYNAHSYHTKVPPKAIQKYLHHYTKPGDLVLDGFCGTGMTGVAAQTSGESIYQRSLFGEQELDGPRKAIISDLSPAATFIAQNYTRKPDKLDFYKSSEGIFQECYKEFSWMYMTKHHEERLSVNKSDLYGEIIYTVWSDVFICPHCSNEIVFWDVAVNEKTGNVNDRFSCPHCGASLSKRDCERAKTVIFDNIINSTIEQAKQVPVKINYKFGGKRFDKVPDADDLALIEKINAMECPYPVPVERIPVGYNTEQPLRSHGVQYVHQFYTKRNLIVYSAFVEKAKAHPEYLFAVSSLNIHINRMRRYQPVKPGGTPGLPGTLFISSINVELSVFDGLPRKVRDISKAFHATNNDVIVSTQSTTDLGNIPENTIDYIFTDPPFGSNLNYSELNFLWESWLKVKTNNETEAIMNSVQGKGLLDYQRLMEACFCEYYRVLKPNRWMTVEFHNSQNAVWSAIQESLQKAGFVVADVRTLDKKQGSFKQVTTSTAVKQDLVISAYKPKQSVTRSILEKVGSAETAWDFVRMHLSNLPIVVVKNGKVEIITERQGYLLFDRMVAYHIMKGIPVPIDAADFYKGLEERFLSRDGMYFLPDQVNEYDTARIVNDIEPIQFSLLVSNEKTAIAWLYQQLDTPQTYAEIQPKFMQEIKTVDRYEDMPELSVLLEENFLQDEKERWYIPDVTKEADVAKLREKNLLKEFEGYLATKGKLKLFRAEAIRVGFAKLWKDKNYKLIVETAERLPEQIIQEDDKLLMYYDISLGRV